MSGRNSYNRFWPSRFLTIALAVWLSGVGCLLCCEAGAEAAETEICAAADDCAMAEAEANNSETHGEEDCCSQHGERSDSPPCQDEGCILDGPPSELPRTPHLVQLIATPTSAAWNFALPDIPPPPSFTNWRPQFPNRRETYLRCCVFLI
jgi:hypothetical protein